MKLHPNGTLEGTPQEIAEYTKMQESKPRFKEIIPSIVEPNHKHGNAGTVYVGVSKSTAKFVEGLLGTIGNKGDLH